VLEREDGYLVARAADPDDRRCRFEREPGFPARQWAENMAAMYNQRLLLELSGIQDGESAPTSTEALLGCRPR
jgi:hypothetical protein